MPLSEEERRQLEALERLLTAEDPVLAEAFQQDSSRRAGPRTVLAILLVFVAFATLIVGVITNVLLVGVLGFLLMIVGGTMTQWTRQRNPLSEQRISTRKNAF